MDITHDGREVSEYVGNTFKSLPHTVGKDFEGRLIVQQIGQRQKPQLLQAWDGSKGSAWVWDTAELRVKSITVSEAHLGFEHDGPISTPGDFYVGIS